MLLLYIVLSVGQTKAELEQFESLQAGIRQSQADVKFTSTYTLTQGMAASFDEGMRKGIDSTLATDDVPVTQGKGVFSKLGAMLRISIDRQTIANPNSGLSFRAFDESSSGDISIQYVTESNGTSAAYVERRSGRDLHFLAPGIFSSPEINPLKPFRDNQPDPFGGLSLVSITQPDADHIDIVTNSIKPNGTDERRTVRLWTKPSLPVVKQITSEAKLKSGKTTKAGAWLRDFQDCPGGMVARNVRFVYKHQDSQAMVIEWVSTDLGKRASTAEDFVITVVPGTKVIGGRAIAGNLDPDKMDPRKALNPRGPDQPVPGKPVQPPRPRI